MSKHLFLMLLMCSVPVVAIKTQEDLNQAIDTLEVAVNQDVTQDQRVIQVIDVLVAKPLTIVVGNMTGNSGDTVKLPIIFKSSTSAISSLQFDLVLPTDTIPKSSEAGPSATAASKSVQSSSTNGIYRVLVFGLNQTTIATGIVAYVNIGINGTAGNRMIEVKNLVGASPTGTSVPLIGKSGSILVN